MHMALKFLRNYLILLVTVFGPLMVLIFGYMPDRLEISVETDRPLSISIGSVENGENEIVGVQTEGCSVGPNAATVDFYIADKIEFGSMGLKFVGGNMNFTIKSFAVVKNLLFRYDLELKGDVEAFCFGPAVQTQYSPKKGVVIKTDAPSATMRFGKGNGFSFSGFELPPIPGVELCFWGFQVFLLFAAAVGLFLNRKAESNQQLWLKAVVIGVVFSTFFALVLPVQLVVGNRNEFPFPISDIIVQVGSWYLICMILSVVLFRLLSLVMSEWIFVPLLALLTYEYLATGILSAGAPSLNGSIDYYLDMKPAIRDAIWLVVVFVSFMVASRWMKKYAIYIALVLLVLMGASLLDVREARKDLAAVAAKQDDSPWSVRPVDVAESLRFSPRRNVIVLIVDSVQSDASYDVIMGNPDLQESFSGFVAYNNNIGAQTYTTLAIPAFFTGRYSPDVKPGQSFVASHALFLRESWAADSFWRNYENHGDAVFLMPDLGKYTYTNRRLVVTSKTASKRREPTSIFARRNSSMRLSLADCLRFRIVPFALKRWALRVSFLGLVDPDGLGQERMLYPRLASHPLSDKLENALVVIGTDGTHDPIHYDENGNRLYRDKSGYAAVKGQTHFVLKLIGGLMGDLKKKGIYDKSMIVIMGDHGSHSNIASRWPHLKDVPGTALPMLWVKPFGATNAFSEVRLPTSHIKLSALLKRACTDDLTQGQIESILETHIRRYRKGRDTDVEYRDMYFDESGALH